MAKSPNAKTNGHTVDALKPVAPKKTAVKAAPKKSASAPAAKPAVKAAAKPALKTAARPALKTATKPAVKAPAKPAAKPAAKTAPKPQPASKPAAKPVAAAPVKPARKVAGPATPKAASKPDAPGTDAPKERKAKLVRDSFTMPEQEYAVLGQVKKACIKAGFEIKKSELLRIGVALISQLDMATLQQVLASLPQLKTGRPKNE